MSDAPHGQWTCEYNEAGKHISYSQDAPTPVEGDYCEFVPPARATNFTIQAVGGGGGGGGGNDERGGTRAYGGGSGAAVYFKFTPEYNISYSINVGKGGKGAPGAVIIEW